jgi:hypothetical protein
MTPSPETAPRPRRRAALIAASAAVLLLIIAGVVLYGVTRQPDSTPSAAAPVTTSAPSPTARSSAASSFAPDPTALADGCLGGPDPFAAILPAQNGATHDINGAAAFARTFGRWSVTYPIDPAAPQVLDTIVFSGSNFAPAALEGLNQLARNLHAQGYTQAKTIADQGAYRISPISTDTRVSLDLILYRQLTRSDGRVEEMKMAITIILERTGTGPWFISGTLPPLGSDPFAPSPAAPWLPFKGAC